MKPVVLLENGELIAVEGDSSGDVLTWNGTEWVPEAPASSGVTSVTASAPLASSGGLTPNISLNDSGVSAATYGSESAVARVTVSAKGLVTSASEQPIEIPASRIISGLLGTARGGIGIDASGVTDGQLLVGADTGSFTLQNVSGDSTLDAAGEVTVVGLQGRVMDATEPTPGQVLAWSGSAWAPADIQGGGGGGGLTLYMNYASSSPYPLDTAFDEHALWDTGAVTVANDANGTELARFYTPSAFVVEVIPAGLWDVNIYMQASGAVNDTAFRVKIAKWDGSTLTVLGDPSDYVYMTDPSVLTQYKASAYVPTTDLVSGEQIAVIIEGRRFAATSQTMTASFGVGAISHVHSTIAAPGGTGLLKVVDGYLQSPASLLVNADVSLTAAIAQSKIAGLVSDLSSINSTLSGKADKTIQVLAGDGLTGGGDLSADVTLALPPVGIAGTYGDAATIPVIQTDAYGRVVTVSPTTVQIGQAQVTDLIVDLDAKADKSTEFVAGVGLTGGGTLGTGGSYALEPLASNPANTYSEISSITVDAYGRVTYVTQSSAVGEAYDFFIQSVGAIGLNEQIFKGKATRDFAFSTTGSQHKFTCDTAPSGGSAVFTVYRGSDVVMVATFADGDAVATVSVTSANVGIAENDAFRVVCTSGPNGISDVYVTLRGTVQDVIPTLTTYAQNVPGDLIISGPMDLVLNSALSWSVANYVLFTYTANFSGNLNDITVNASGTGFTAGALVHDTTNKRIIVPLT